MKMMFTLKGKSFNLEKEEVVKAMKNIEPERISKYYVEIHDKKYPIKQVIAQTLKVPIISFTSMDAYNILNRLGFEIKEEKK
jgi:hypothetical protein